MVLDEALEGRIAEIVRPLMKRWPNLDVEAIGRATASRRRFPRARPCSSRSARRRGSWCRRRGAASGPTVVVLPGPPRELQPMWGAGGRRPRRCRRRSRGATEYRQRMLRLFGIPESEIAETLRVAEREGVELEQLEITTCLKRGEVEVVTRYEPDAQGVYDAFEAVVARAPRATRCSPTTAAPSTSRSPSCCAETSRPRDDRHGRVVHGRPARGAADRARRAPRTT